MIINQQSIETTLQEAAFNLAEELTRQPEYAAHSDEEVNEIAQRLTDECYRGPLTYLIRTLEGDNNA